MIKVTLETSLEKRILLLVILISVIIISYTVCVKLSNFFSGRYVSQTYTTIFRKKINVIVYA
jgi:hypothetical protein